MMMIFNCCTPNYLIFKRRKSEGFEEFKEYILLSDLQYEPYTYTKVQIKGCHFKFLILQSSLRREILQYFRQ